MRYPFLIDDMKKQICYTWGIWLLLLIAACKEDLPPNPYDGIIGDQVDTSLIAAPDPNSIAGLHQNMFGPTCANSGCHDGTFEPDYRTIESTYNTLVFQPIIKNDTAGTYTYRVLPGNVNQSMLYVRLTEDLNGNSGIMPLEVEPGSDWFDKKDDYIQNVVNWIEAGSPDILGNLPVLSNTQPQMLGVQAYPTGSSTAYGRASNGSIRVPAGTTSIDIWFSLTDDVTATEQLLHNKVKFSLFMNEFDNAQERDLTIVGTPRMDEGYEGQTVAFYHKITVDPAEFQQAATNNLFMRIYVKDPENDITEIPGQYSENVFKTYFTLIFFN